MTAEPLPKANPRDVLFQIVWFRLVYLLFGATYLTVLWFVLGPSNPGYALGVVWGASALVPAVSASVMQRVPRQRFHVHTGERLLHRIVGVGTFGWLLECLRMESSRRTSEGILG